MLIATFKNLQTLTSVPLSREGVLVNQIAPILKEVSSVSAHLVSLVMEGAMEMDAQVSHTYMYVKQYSLSNKKNVTIRSILYKISDM